MFLLSYIPVAILAFLLGLIDGSIGMGYGTILTPVLLLIGFDPLRVVPAVLCSQLAGDFLAAFFHHRFENVNLVIGSKHLKVAAVLALLSLFGSIIAVVTAFNLPQLVINLFVGALFAVSGLIVLGTRNKNHDFSWTRLLCLGSLAAFNKGVSGGGYGPVVTTGQILAGIEAKSAIGIISLAEGITCVAAVLTYFLAGTTIDLELSIMLAIGVVISAPLAAFIVKKMRSRRLRLLIGTLTLVLGLLTIVHALI